MRLVESMQEVIGERERLPFKPLTSSVPAHKSSKKCPHCACRKNRMRKSHVYGPFNKNKLTRGVQLVEPRVSWYWNTGPLNWIFGTPSTQESDGWYEIHVYAYCSNPECPVPRERVKHVARKFSRFRLAILWIKARLLSGIEMIAPCD